MTVVQEIPADRLSRMDCQRIITLAFLHAKFEGECTIYLTKNHKRYIRISYDRGKYYSYVSTRKGDLLLRVRTIDQLTYILLDNVPASVKYS